MGEGRGSHEDSERTAICFFFFNQYKTPLASETKLSISAGSRFKFIHLHVLLPEASSKVSF